jgi:hypothetical protein
VAPSFTPCAGQAWLRSDTMLWWKSVRVQESDYTYEYCGLPFLASTDGSSPIAADFLRISRTSGGANLVLPVVFAPDRTKMAFRSPSGKGVSSCDADGSNCGTWETDSKVTAVAWESPNPRAPLHEADVAGPPATPPPLTDGSEIPAGAAGTPSSSDDCTTGRWYPRTPKVLPSNWPLAVDNYASVYDSSRGVVVVHASGPKADPKQMTWEWDGTQGIWTNRSSAIPSWPRVPTSLRMVFDSKRGLVVAIESEDDQNGDSALIPWTWDPTQGTWANLGCSVPHWREVLNAVYDDGLDSVWIGDDFGGGFQWKPSTCASTSFQAPLTNAARLGVRWAFDSWRKLVYQFGDEGYEGKVMVWNGATSRWTSSPAPSTGPGIRRYAAMAFDADRGRLMVFSGMMDARNGSASVPADLWEWNPDSNLWTLCGSGAGLPVGRYFATMHYDSKRHALVLLGGTNSSGYLPEIWEWAIP